MKVKIIAFCLLAFLCQEVLAQAWKSYPYSPAGSLVSFPADEGRHTSEPIEWWYVAGQLTGQTSGKSYSYMFTFFHYPQSGFDGFRILNITDDDTGAFYQDVRPLNYTVLSTTGLDIEASIFLGGTEYFRNQLDGSNDPIPFQYELFGSNGTTESLDIQLDAQKRPLILGDDGFLNQGLANYTYYFSLTENDVSGTIMVGGVSEPVVGKGWIDRQYGDFNPLTGEKYEWFSLKLSNGMDINLWNIFTVDRTIPNTPEYRILSAWVDDATQTTSSDFTIERLSYFCTPDDVNCYSSSWQLTSVTHDLDLTITADHTTTEVQLPFRFFEGVISISGTVGGTTVTGVGFAELLHYYEDPAVTIDTPSGGFYDVTQPISWTLDNPDDGRPVFYDLEYSIDNQNSFLPIVQDLTSPSYLWGSPAVNEGDDVWFKIIAHSIDGTLISETISDVASTTTLSLNEAEVSTAKLFPNPSSEEFYLTFNSAQTNISIEVTDINGRSVSILKANNESNMTIDLGKMTTGYYFIKVETDTFYDVFKVIKR